jgi:transcriptional regulator with XRE-family HTH domain
MKTRTRSRGRPSGPQPVDVHVGFRIRLRRTLLGMSQAKLGEGLGLTFQQVQKYEKGTNRVGASRMHEIARVLDVPIPYFYEGLDAIAASRDPAVRHDAAAPDPMMKRETLELVRAYYKIKDANVRKLLFEMTKALAA